MEHIHEHDHDHHHGFGHHHHPVNLKEVSRAFVIGIIMNFAFVVVEVVTGLHIHSLSLLSDAGHNLADVASLAMALIAIRLLKVRPTERFTYGYKKTTILVALFNAAVLLVSLGAIGYEALHRFAQPESVPGKTISIVAGIGILVNAITALLFFRNKENDMNVRGAFLHLMSDAIVSAGLVVGGLIIVYTHITWIDPALSLIIAVVILFSTWQLLKDSLRLSLDGVPEGIHLARIKGAIGAIKGVVDFHHIHVWAISTSENALTAHLVVEPNSDLATIEKLKSKVKHELLHQKIQHATLEIETENAPCQESDC
ncbi:MAG: cation diffusion facilitator family transporter [Bacteroidota bacterium]|nr:cation diffusion facilitator family transporter [Bacteroidota bacterium]MDP4248051.1 cation diffusion facilitator family transporter [Bacteroidota bacterium]MDP4254492.1 cation diffusion facilitator family transporter [Bacteroidota bacterium]MDP4257202.1 cation diffusion facilitator family transporter [Bacteroidota bacterium]